jgi:hypothetical protein
VTLQQLIDQLTQMAQTVPGYTPVQLMIEVRRQQMQAEVTDTAVCANAQSGKVRYVVIIAEH